MDKKIVLLIGVVCFVAGTSYAKTQKEDFEKGSLKDWEIEGDAKISSDQKHSGTKSLFVPKGSKAIWITSKENKFGKVTFWVYDSRVGGKFIKHSNGPSFGIADSDSNYFVLGMIERIGDPFRWGTYYYCSSVVSIFGWWYPDLGTKANIAKGWHKFLFNIADSKTLEVIRDDEKQGNIDLEKVQFSSGFAGVYFSGGADGEETFYYDDIEIEMK